MTKRSALGLVTAVGLFGCRGNPPATATDGTGEMTNGTAVAPIAIPELDAVPTVATTRPAMIATRVRKIDALKGLRGGESSCLVMTSSAPVLRFTLAEEAPETFELAIEDTVGMGFAIVSDGAAPVVDCTPGTGARRTWRAPKRRWPAGTYAVYPVSSNGSRAGALPVMFSDPARKVAWRESTRRITLDKSSTAPLFVDVPVQASRTMSSDYTGCAGTYPKQPDLVLLLDRPIAGLTIEPLYPALGGKVRVAREGERAGACTASKAGPAARSLSLRDNDAPASLGVWLGAERPEEVRTVTLMIYDRTTRFDPLDHPASVSAETIPVEERAIGNFFPGLRHGTVGSANLAAMTLTSDLFAAAPRQAFVYAKTNVDAAIAKVVRGPFLSPFPVKDEPLLLLGFERGDATVLTADGGVLTMKRGWLSAAPEGRPAIPAAPRALQAKLEVESLASMHPQRGKALLLDLARVDDQHTKCSARVWAGYDKRLDAEVWTVRRGGREITIESPRYSAIMDEAERATEATCGKAGTDSPKVLALRQRAGTILRAEIDAERKALFERATARFRSN